jgi:hypothetical protein
MTEEVFNEKYKDNICIGYVANEYNWFNFTDLIIEYEQLKKSSFITGDTCVIKYKKLVDTSEIDVLSIEYVTKRSYIVLNPELKQKIQNICEIYKAEPWLANSLMKLILKDLENGGRFR